MLTTTWTHDSQGRLTAAWNNTDTAFPRADNFATTVATPLAARTARKQVGHLLSVAAFVLAPALAMTGHLGKRLL